MQCTRACSRSCVTPWIRQLRSSRGAELATRADVPRTLITSGSGLALSPPHLRVFPNTALYHDTRHLGGRKRWDVAHETKIDSERGSRSAARVKSRPAGWLIILPVPGPISKISSAILARRARAHGAAPKNCTHINTHAVDTRVYVYVHTYAHSTHVHVTLRL